MKKFNKWFLVFMAAFALASCGGGSESGGSGSNVVNETNDSTSSNPSLPSNVSDFRDKIINDEFVKIVDGAPFTGIRAYHQRCDFTVNQPTSSFSKFWDQIKSSFSGSSCSNPTTYTNKEYTDSHNVTSAFLGTSSRTDHINELVNIIDSADQTAVTSVGYNTYYGYQYKNILVTKNGDAYYYFDLTSPASANPVLKSEKVSGSTYRSTQYTHYNTFN